MKFIAAALVALLSLTSQALAWGYEGHRIVAEIAEQYLEPETARQVRELLALLSTERHRAAPTEARPASRPRLLAEFPALPTARTLRRQIARS